MRRLRAAGKSKYKLLRLHPYFSFLAGLFLLIALLGRATEGTVASSSDYLVEAWATDSGLPHSSVTSLAQTPDGYLWIGTLHGGLARFDGERFVNFHPGNTPALKSIEIQKLLVDKQGTLWISVVEGILISYRDGRFQFERKNTQTPQNWLEACVSSTTNETVLSSIYGWIFRGTRAGATNRWETLIPPNGKQGAMSCQDADGTIWFRTADNRLGVLRGTNFVRLANPPGLKSPQINAQLIGADGRLWVGTEQELAVWDGKTFVDMTPTNGVADLAVRQMAVCRDGSFWVWTVGQLRKCAGRKWLATAAPWDEKDHLLFSRSHLFADSRGDAWVTHESEGLWHIGGDGAATHITEKDGLPNGFVRCWFEDREKNIWVGLADGGLACVRPRIFHTQWPTEGSHFTAKTVCEDRDGTMWFGTGGNNFLRWRDGIFDVFALPVEPMVGADTTVSPDGAGRLWVGGVQNGLFAFTNGGFSRPFPSQAIGTVARVLFTDHAGALWIGSEFGLFRWRDGVLKDFSTNENFTAAYVLAITEDKAGDIWIGTAIGELRRFKNGKFETFRPLDSLTDNATVKAAAESSPMESRDRGALSSGGERFWSLHTDDDGVIWIGTLGGGLLRFQDGKFTRYGLRDGLPSEHISQILEDGHGQLWLGTRNGIVRVSKKTLNEIAGDGRKNLSCVSYGKFDGLPAVECAGGSQPACWRSRDGRLWFTTIKGAVWMNPEELPSNKMLPPVFIEGISVDGKDVSADEKTPPHPGMAAPKELRVAAGRHYFEFKFTALSLTSPDKVRFKWRLANLEKNWVEGGDRRVVSYSFIPPGSYEFQVQACNNDGVWNETGDSVKLIVRPYFWQTWWFTPAIVVGIGILLAAIYSVRVARLQALERLRLRIARDLHDEVGANLASISLLSQLMEISPSAADATQVRGIAVQTIDTLRDIIWFIDPLHDRLSDLVARLQETAKLMLPGVKYKFESSGDFRSANLPLAFRRNVPPMFKEALHNLLKHSHASEVEILASRVENNFQFRIRDNGVGFATSNKSSGNGLKNLKRRAAEIGGNVEINSAPGGGTTVTLTAPIPQTRDWWKKKTGLTSS